MKNDAARQGTPDLSVVLQVLETTRSDTGISER